MHERLDRCGRIRHHQRERGRPGGGARDPERRGAIRSVAGVFLGRGSPSFQDGERSYIVKVNSPSRL